MSPIVQAAFWMTGTIVSFSAMAVAGREMAGSHDTYEIMLYRSIVGLVIVYTVARLAGTWHEITRTQLGLHWVRNIAHFTGQNLWFYAVTVIPLAQVFALEFTSPIWVILLAPLLLGERLTATRVFAGVLGFIGVLIVTRPTVDGLNIGIIAAAVAAVFFATTNLLTRKLTWTHSVTCILFYLTGMQLVLGLFAVFWDMQVALPTAATLPWIITVGLAGLLAHFCLTKALSIAPAIVVMPFDFIRLPTIAVIGMILYQEPLDGFVLLGAGVICVGIYINLWSEARSAKHA